jgi:hypothetical protein
MSKRDKKRKKKAEDADEYRGVGLLTSMRGGFKSAVGTGGKSGRSGPKTGWALVKDIAFWVVIAALIAVVFYRFAGRRF